MFGRIEQIDGRTEPVTLAGPNPGIVEKVNYTNTNDYPLVMTQGCLGMGNIGYASSNPITYNPFCVVGTDEETGEPIRKGVLVVDCIKSESIEGGDCAKYLEYNTANNNASYNIPLWSTTNTADGYREQYVSGGRPLTYNPISGELSTCCICANANVRVGSNNSVYTCIRDNWIYGVCNATCLRFNNCIYVGQDYVDARGLYSYVKASSLCSGNVHSTTECLVLSFDDDGTNWAYMPWEFECDVYIDCTLTTCCICTCCGIRTGYDIVGYCEACWGCGPYWYIYCNGEACFGKDDENVEFQVCGCICTCCLSTCNINIGCDAYFAGAVTANEFTTDGVSIRSNSIIATEADAIFGCCITKQSNTYCCAWANNTGVPNCSEVRQYIYCHCGVTGYANGNTLYLRNLGCAGWN